MFLLFLLFFISKAQTEIELLLMHIFMNDPQSLVNTIITDKFFSKLFGYKMHLPQDNICLDNTLSNNSDIHTIEYLNV